MSQKRKRDDDSDGDDEDHKGTKKAVLFKTSANKPYHIGSNCWRFIISFCDVATHLTAVCQVSKQMRHYACHELAWPAKISLRNSCLFALNSNSGMLSHLTRELSLCPQPRKHGHVSVSKNAPFNWCNPEFSKALTQVGRLCPNLELVEIRNLATCTDDSSKAVPPYLTRNLLTRLGLPKPLGHLRVLLNGDTNPTTDLLNLAPGQVDHLFVGIDEQDFNVLKPHHVALHIADYNAKHVELRRLMFMSSVLPKAPDRLCLQSCAFLLSGLNTVLAINRGCQLRVLEMDNCDMLQMVNLYSRVAYFCPLLEEVKGTQVRWECQQLDLADMTRLPESKALQKLDIRSTIVLHGHEAQLGDGTCSRHAKTSMMVLSHACMQRELKVWRLELAVTGGAERHVWQSI
jgi:hypothetical protein